MNEPKVEYELERAVTGVVSKKVPCVLEDGLGNKLKAPWSPRKKCNRCYGRGFVGKNTETNELIPCRLCYPWKKE